MMQEFVKYSNETKKVQHSFLK